MNKYVNIFRNWFAYAAIITFLCGIIYIVVQQNFRLSANDPQVQMAEDAANALKNGADPKLLISTPAVDISRSQAAYMVIYDITGNRIIGNATLNGKPLQIPKGVIDYVDKNGKDAATWQPQPDVRQAMVGIRGKNYIAFTGRSLRNTEERISLLGEQVVFGWAMSLVAMAVVAFLQERLSQKSATS